MDVLDMIEREVSLESKAKEAFKEYYAKRLARMPFVHKVKDGRYVDYQLDNVWASHCFSCKEFPVWVAETCIYPVQKHIVEPAEDMPTDTKADFIEAGSIVETSRGARRRFCVCACRN